jgi:hypothetical protein
MLEKDTHVIGKRVELIKMEGEPQMESGMKGIIESVDDLNQYHVRWDNGSKLAIIPEQDEFKIL